MKDFNSKVLMLLAFFTFLEVKSQSPIHIVEGLSEPNWNLSDEANMNHNLTGMPLKNCDIQISTDSTAIKRRKNKMFSKIANKNYEICPVCLKNDEVIPIRYGKPNLKLQKMAEEGKVRLGGCELKSKSSYCKRDNLEF